MPNLKPCAICLLILLLSACNNSIKYPDGGYDYPKHVADKDTNFYLYAMKDVLSHKDSVEMAVAYLSYKPYDEPNISLKPLGYDEFRLYYDLALGYTYLITLTEKEIVIKKGNSKIYYDQHKLSNAERFDYRILMSYYPFDHHKKEIPEYIDSLVKVYPQLTNPNYYKSLLVKMTNKNDSFAYTTKRIPITKKRFEHFAAIINNSGYWTFPYAPECDREMMDGWGYILEANTSKKYNCVHITTCPGNVVQAKLDSACQQIVDFLHMEKEILIWSNEVDTNSSHIVVHDVELDPEYANKKHYQPHKDSTVQGSDTTKLN